MRILQVHTRYRQAGGEDAVVETERAMLQGAGHSVGRYIIHNPHGVGATLASLAKAPWNATTAAAVLDAARGHRADVVHVHNTWFALSPSVFPILKAAGFPVVATIHNYRLTCVNALLYREGAPCCDCVGRLPWRGVVHRCYRESATQSGAVAVTIAAHRVRKTWERDVDLLIVLTRFASEMLVRSGIPESRMVVKPNVVTDPGPRIAPPSASKTILYVGRLTEEKGIIDLIDAWGRVERFDANLMVIGDGPLRDVVKATAGTGVEVVGRVPSDEVRRRMLTARALVLPSRWFEGLPMALLEAMAAGLPVVVPDHGAMVEIAGLGGIAFAGCDVSSLAGALDNLGDSELVDRRGGASRREYLDRFEPANGVAQLVEIYERACAGNTRP